MKKKKTFKFTFTKAYNPTMKEEEKKEEEEEEKGRKLRG